MAAVRDAETQSPQRSTRKQASALGLSQRTFEKNFTLRSAVLSVQNEVDTGNERMRLAKSKEVV